MVPLREAASSMSNCPVAGLWLAAQPRYLIVADDGRSLEIWDLEDRVRLAVVAAKSEHETIMTATMIGTEVRWLDIHGELWTARDGAAGPCALTRLPCNGIWSACHSNDATRLFVARRDERIQMLDAETGDILWESRVEHHSCRPFQCRFTPDGTRVVTVSPSDHKKRIRVWSASTGQILATYRGYENSRLLATDDQYAYCAGMSVSGYAAYQFDLEAAQHQNSFESVGNHITAVAIHGATRLLLLGTEDGAILAHDTRQSYHRPACWGQHASTVTQIAISPCGRFKVSAAQDGAIWLW